MSAKVGCTGGQCQYIKSAMKTVFPDDGWEGCPNSDTHLHKFLMTKCLSLPWCGQTLLKIDCNYFDLFFYIISSLLFLIVLY